MIETENIDCPNCQGCGCTTCMGFGFLTQTKKITMNIEKAKQALWDGQKITHKLFALHEFIYIENGQMFDEENIPIDMQDFWNERTGSQFKEGWEFSEMPNIPKTGIKLISEERQEQINKHSNTIENDVLKNNNYQLSQAAGLLMWIGEEDYGHDLEGCCPQEWNIEEWEYMMTKDYKERLIIAGALIAAEIDRLQYVKSGENADSNF